MSAAAAAPIFVLGPHVDRDDYNRLLYRDGKGLLPGRLKEVKQAGEARLFAFHATSAALAATPLDIFSDDRDRASLMNVRFRKYLAVEPSERTQRVLSFLEEATAGGAATASRDADDKQFDPAIVAWHPARVFGGRGDASRRAIGLGAARHARPRRPHHHSASTWTGLPGRCPPAIRRSCRY